MTATLEQAQADLESDLAPRLIDALRRAVRIFLDKHADLAADYSSRSVASLLHDYMVLEVTREFVADPRVVIAKRRGLVTVTMLDKYVFKLKRLDRNLRTRNIPTQTTLAFLAQVPLPFVDLPEASTHLHAGYRPGHILSEATFWIVCQDGNRLSWRWAFDTMPSPPAPITKPDDTSRTGRVVPKPAVEKPAVAEAE